jgi:hypothetical protein
VIICSRALAQAVHGSTEGSGRRSVTIVAPPDLPEISGAHQERGQAAFDLVPRALESTQRPLETRDSGGRRHVCEKRTLMPMSGRAEKVAA